MTGLQVQEIEQGLWWWSAPHPEWDPDPEPTTGWVEAVGSYYCELPGALLLIDPVVPADASDAERLWRALDRDVERLRRPVCVATTVHWHRRGADAIVARYGARDDVVPEGARALPLGDPIGETAYVLPRFRALVVGDVVIGGDAIAGEPGERGARMPARLVRQHRLRAGLVPRRRAAERPAASRAGARRAHPRDPRLAAPERRRGGAARARRRRERTGGAA